MSHKVRISKKAVRRESCRVAAAFGVRFFGPLTLNPAKRKLDSHFNGRTKQQVEITWVLNLLSVEWITIYVFGGGGKDERYCSVDRNGGSIFLCSHIDSHYNEIMARGLYCLGFEDEAILSQLPPLTNHEKLELRLSMPREFWPKTWQDEANAHETSTACI